MIALDTSAVVAIVLGEPDAERYLSAITSTPAVMATVSLVEAQIVAEARQGVDAARDVDLLVEGAAVEVAPVDRQLGLAARDAWRRFGRGRHPARLNFGDCFSYALARSRGLPLLYKGDDFARTDVEPVI